MTDLTQAFEQWVLGSSRRPGTHVRKDAQGKYLDNRVAAKYVAFNAGAAYIAAVTVELQAKIAELESKVDSLAWEVR